MSKETTAGVDCPGCGQKICFAEYHIDHCVNTQLVNLRKAKAKKNKKDRV